MKSLMFTALSALAGRPHPGLHNPSGYIGFLGHTMPVRFRNIRVKEL